MSGADRAFTAMGHNEHMRILGLSGSFNTTADPWVPGLPRGFFHDAAAALVTDGEVVAAVEEERRNRIKHTHDFPVQAVSTCLALAGTDLDGVDEIAFFFAEDFLDAQLAGQALALPGLPMPGARGRLAALLGLDAADDRLHFVPHHVAHAASAFYESGLRRSAVLVMDGHGETESVSAYRGGPEGLSLVSSSPESASLGQLYFRGTRFLGFGLFDEYKVMGLAPHGDPERYRAAFRQLYEMRPDGSFQFDHASMDERLLATGIRPRRAGEPLGKRHRDFAAALQETLETIVLHMARTLLVSAGEDSLCLAGGVAQNSTLNGVLASSGLWREVFVHPAANDAGSALGAALYRYAQRDRAPVRRRASTALGTDIGTGDQIRPVLEAWSDHLRFQRCEDIAAQAAVLLAQDAVIGWVQGRAEFGPRALGQRSIVADPRPVSNRDRINRLVKRREEFRPLAPAVLAERAAEFFELPAARINAEFMTFTVPVRIGKREALGAVTHVDGSARLQTVPPHHTLFRRLISEFGRISGIPVILNTSFNNDSEPIADTAEDAVRTFLTSQLDALAIGSFLVTRIAAAGTADTIGGLVPVLPATSALCLGAEAAGQRVWSVFERAHPHDHRRRTHIAAATAAVLVKTDGHRDVAALSGGTDSDDLHAELLRLWDQRLVDLRPPARQECPRRPG